jgi:small-conductance mechanosensitive channel
LSARRRLVGALLVLITAALVTSLLEVFISYFSKELEEVYARYRGVIHVVVALAVGVVTIQLLASATIIWLHRRREAYLVRNVVLILGYIVLGFVVASMLGVSGESLLASATFSGLILGLALQPVLSNFFSGLLILVSGYIKPGQTVRIAGGIPLSLIAFPAYKFFSRDYMIPSLKGEVLEIGLLYTKILDVDGNVVKVSNNILLNSSVVLEETSESRLVQIRYEYPVTCSPDVVLNKLHEALHNVLDDYNLYIEEQIDKQYYIVLLVATTPPETRTREFRSRLLKEFIKVHRELILNGLCTQAK